MWAGTIGGAERAVFQFIRSQVQLSRYIPAIAYSRESGFYGGEIRKLGVDVIDLGLHRDFSVTEARRVKALIKDFEIHHFHAPEVTPMLASVLCDGVRRVYTHRSGDFAYSGKQWLRYEFAGFMTRHYFHGLVGNTGLACRSGARVTRTDSSRWRTVYNGIDFSLLRAQRSRENVASEIGLPLDDRAVIGTSAHLRDWKRIDWLIRACAKLEPTSYHLLIVGDGPARPQLETLSKELKVESRTIFTGMKEHMGDYLQLMDIFALPSSSAESFGNSAVEAMGQGLPTIVCSDGGGLVEHVRHAETGFIIASIDELANRIRELQSNGDLRQRLGNAAREHVTRKYSYENLVGSYDNLYDTVLAK